MNTRVTKVGKDLLRIDSGIYTTLRCTKCGQNLPLFVWECLHCSPQQKGETQRKEKK